MWCQIILFLNGLTLFTTIVICVVCRKELTIAVRMAMNIAQSYTAGNDPTKRGAFNCEGLPPAGPKLATESANMHSGDKKDANKTNNTKKRIKFTK